MNQRGQLVFRRLPWGNDLGLPTSLAEWEDGRPFLPPYEVGDLDEQGVHVVFRLSLRGRGGEGL